MTSFSVNPARLEGLIESLQVLQQLGKINKLTKDSQEPFYELAIRKTKDVPDSDGWLIFPKYSFNEKVLRDIVSELVSDQLERIKETYKIDLCNESIIVEKSK